MNTIKRFKCKGEHELSQGYASYATLVKDCLRDLVLCNNVTKVDEYLIDNIENGKLTCCTIDEDDYNSDERLKDEYETYQDLLDSGDYDEYKEIYQYYLCNITEWQLRYINDNYPDELIISYSEVLNCDVLCVDHFGTSWDYVLTNVKIED